MKTLFTTLPIYDSLIKQAYQRSSKSTDGKLPVKDQIAPVPCPRHRLPSFQFPRSGVEVITHVYLVGDTTTEITTYFPLLTAVYRFDYSANRVTYNGQTLNTILDAGIYYLQIELDSGVTYYSEHILVTCVFGTETALPPTATYSENYLIFNFFNSCDLGDILYVDGFTQTLWLDSEPMEFNFTLEESGQQNGYGRFVRTFGRQTKKYTVVTNKMPYFMVDVFNRMKLHDNVTLTDLVGDTNNVYNLEVDHEWLFEDKYYAKITLTFDYDESVVVTGCCTNIT